MDAITSPHLLPLAGLVIGLVFGLAVQRSDWCAMGAVSDIVLIGDWRRMRSWLLAIATAILGTQALLLADAIELAGTAHLRPEIAWLGAIAGGLAFGFGMTRTGGCISKNLVRLGGGSLRALVVLAVVAVTALATLAGPLPWAGALLDGVGTVEPGLRFPRQDLPALVGLSDGVSAFLATGIAVGLAWFCLKDRRFRASRPLLVAGPILGLLVSLGWLATTALADPPGPMPTASLNFVEASVSTLALLTAGGVSMPPFGAALVGGTILGAFLGASRSGRLRLEGFVDVHDFRSNLGGAVLMGFGGTLAGGCTVGQGLTGISTLGPTSILAVAAIVLGAIAGVRTLEAGGLRGAFRATAGS